MDLHLKGRYRVTDLETGRQLLSGRGMAPADFSVCEQSLCVDGRALGTDAVRVRAARGVGVRSGPAQTWYRGEIDIAADAQGRLNTINRLGLEDYLRGVVPREMSPGWPAAALQAQAVASRTYALYRIARAEQQPFDVSADVLSQVYDGRSVENRRTNRAIRRTRGRVLQHTGTIVPAVFHANCGGHTENAFVVWGLDSEALQGIDCPYCAGRPGYAWKRNFHSRAVQEQLNSSGYVIGLIREIEVVRRSPSGRARTLRIHDRDTATLEIPATEFRAILGPDVVRSNRYEVVMQGYYFDLIGRGWGHGVGMCQHGACGMAHAGRSMREILRFYYNGAQITKIY